MADVNLKRNARLEGDHAIIESEVVEQLDKDEYMALFIKKSKDAMSLDYAIKDAKHRLEQLKDIKDDPEIQKLKEMLINAEKLRERDELKEKLKEMEKTLARFKIEVEAMKPVYNQLKPKG